MRISRASLVIVRSEPITSTSTNSIQPNSYGAWSQRIEEVDESPLSSRPSLNHVTDKTGLEQLNFDGMKENLEMFKPEIHSLPFIFLHASFVR